MMCVFNDISVVIVEVSNVCMLKLHLYFAITNCYSV